MAGNQVLIFDIKAAYAFFKTSEVTRATISLPFSRTSIVGILGAMLGKPRNSYWTANDPLGTARIGLELLNDIQHVSLTVNYTHTRNTISVGSAITTFLPSGPGSEFRGFVTDVRLDLLRDIHYRVYFSTTDEKLYAEIKHSLENGLFEYPPYLGHANMLAELIYIGESAMTPTGNDTSEIATVVARSLVADVFFDVGVSRLVIYTRIPLSMEIEDGKVVYAHKEDFITSVNCTTPLKIKLKDNNIIYEVQVEGKKKAIVFMPSNGLALSRQGTSQAGATKHEPHFTLYMSGE